MLSNNVLIYTFDSNPQKLASFETGDNDGGAASIATSDRSEWLAFPGKKSGHVQIIELSRLAAATHNNVENLGGMNETGLVDSESSSSYKSSSNGRSNSSIISAHESDVSCLAFNLDGTLLATASKKGTLIRVFDAVTGSLVHEFRRGADRAEIWSIAFSKDSSKLCMGSDKGTIHIFKLSVHAIETEQQHQPNKQFK
jgi:WD repeat-containing protein 45